MLKTRLNQFFWQFADNIFIYKGEYPYNTELVFAFAQYVEDLPDQKLQEIFPDFASQKIRHLINTGVDYWLKKNVKTMCIL